MPYLRVDLSSRMQGHARIMIGSSISPQGHSGIPNTIAQPAADKVADGADRAPSHTCGKVTPSKGQPAILKPSYAGCKVRYFPVTRVATGANEKYDGIVPYHIDAVLVSRRTSPPFQMPRSVLKRCTHATAVASRYFPLFQRRLARNLGQFFALSRPSLIAPALLKPGKVHIKSVSVMFRHVLFVLPSASSSLHR